MNSRLTGLPPIIDTRAHTLILGSFPSEASLAAQQYYAHKQNHFWRILGDLIRQPLADMDYAKRCLAVRAAGIAIWDVYAQCEREGSSDSAIRSSVANDFSRLEKLAPRLRRVCFNGKTAARFQRQLAEMGYAINVLPSTSPAYTLPYENKLIWWRMALSDAAKR